MQQVANWVIRIVFGVGFTQWSNTPQKGAVQYPDRDGYHSLSVRLTRSNSSCVAGERMTRLLLGNPLRPLFRWDVGLLGRGIGTSFRETHKFPPRSKICWDKIPVHIYVRIWKSSGLRASSVLIEYRFWLLTFYQKFSFCSIYEQ